MSEISGVEPEIVIEIAIDCRDLEVMAKFWMSALGYLPGVADIERYADSDTIYYALVDPKGTGRAGPKIILQKVPEAKTVKNRLHLNLHVVDIEADSERLVRLGAHRIDQIPFSEAGAVWIRLADPEENEFCLVLK
jgi:predicted enzyme related to lactoylglutathione lyase